MDNYFENSFDFGQVIYKLILVFLVSQFLRKYFDTQVRNPKLDQYLKFSWLPTFLLFVILGLFKIKESEKFFYYFLFSFIIYCTYQLNDSKISRNVLIAILPLFTIKTFDNFFVEAFPKLLENYRENLDSFTDFASFWLIGFSFYAFRQGKKDIELRKKEKEEHDQLLAQKNTLEYQVAERTAEISKQKEELEKSILELKNTQSQLIQSEKMASLGELTAGIAHEIQNPLNFVNNFSEVSVELCDELNEHLNNESIDKNYIKEIITDLSQNQQKITHHGQRAASIVKGMLLHSRTNTGEKELTDINALTDEYLRLSYHGLRAKDKSFNADFKTDFDPNLPKLNVIPQDLGRVFLNLINNAFFAVTETQNINGSQPQTGLKDIKPTVSVSTQKLGDKIIIKIKDNGIGMNEATKSKIFQPFFTTKPTGQGTGLGLSLAYDIVTKGHGGTIECNSIEGKGTEFIISLPIT
jgi:signal transduction histidine kinase